MFERQIRLSRYDADKIMNASVPTGTRMSSQNRDISSPKSLVTFWHSAWLGAIRNIHVRSPFADFGYFRSSPEIVLPFEECR